MTDGNKAEGYVSPIGIPFGGAMLGVGDVASPEYQTRQDAGGLILGGEPLATGRGLNAPAIAQEPVTTEMEIGDPIGTLSRSTGFMNDPAFQPEAPKGGKAGASGYVEGEISPPIPGELQAAQMAHMGRLADLEFIGYQARAAAWGLEADLNRDMGALLEKDFEGTMKRSRDLLATAEREAAAVDDLIEAAKSNRINPGQFFANIGDAGKFAAALAVGAGAMASAFGGGPNVAYDIISRAIDRNVRAQMVNQEHDRAMISHQINYLNTIRGLSTDQAQLGHVYRIGLTALAQARVGEIRAGYGETAMQLAAQQVHDRLFLSIAEAKIKYLQNTKYKVHIGYQGMRQLNHALAAMNAATGMVQRPGPQAPRQGAPAALGAGAPSAPRVGAPPSAQPRPGPQGSLGARVMQQAQSNPRFAQMSPKDQAALVGQMIQAEATRTGEDVKADTVFSTLQADPRYGPDTPFGQELQNMDRTRFEPVGKQGTETFYAAGRQSVLPLRDKEQWKERGVGYRTQKMAEISSGLEAIELTRELFKLVGQFSRGEGGTGKLLVRGPNGELLVPVMGTTDETEALSRLNTLGLALANAKRTEKGSDAIKSLEEWNVWKDLTAGRITDFDEFVQIMRNDPAVRQAGLKPFLRYANDTFLKNATPDFVIPDAFYEESIK